MKHETGDSLAQLRRNWLFASEPAEQLEAVLGFADVRWLERNQTLFWQADPVGHVFLVLSGSLKLIRRDRKDRCKITRIAGAPDLVALHCLFTENGYAATAVAMDDCSVLAINAERLLWHMKKNPELGWRVTFFLSREVEGMTEEIGRLAMGTASERLAAYLLSAHEDSEYPNEQKFPRRRADLASLLSLSTETLCREISKFRGHGWIATHDKGFTVLEPERLRGLVESKSDN